MEKTNINITEEIARIEEEVAQLEKELEELQKEQEEYATAVEEAQSNEFIAASARTKIEKNLKEKIEEVQKKQQTINEKRKQIENLSKLILTVAYDSIEKDDEMVDAIIAGYIQNIDDDIKEQEQTKKEIDAGALEFINLLKSSIPDEDFDEICESEYKPSYSVDLYGLDRTMKRYIRELQNDKKRIERLSKKIEQLHSDGMHILDGTTNMYEDLTKIVSALKLDAFEYNSNNQFYITKLVQIERIAIITELNESKHKNKIADEDTIVLLNGRGISKQTIKGLIKELKTLEPTQEQFNESYDKMYSNLGYTNGNIYTHHADPEIKLSKDQIEFRKEQLYELLKHGNPSVSVHKKPEGREYIIGPNSEEVDLSSLREQLRTILNEQNAKTKLSEICEKFGLRRYYKTDKPTSRLLEIIKKYIDLPRDEDKLYALEKIGILDVFKGSEDLLLPLYRETVESKKTNDKADAEIEALRKQKEQLESLDISKRREYIRGSLSAPSFEQNNLMSPQFLETLSQKITDYSKKVDRYVETRKQLEINKGYKATYDEIQNEYKTALEKLSSFGISEEEVGKISDVYISHIIHNGTSLYDKTIKDTYNRMLFSVGLGSKEADETFEEFCDNLNKDFSLQDFLIEKINGEISKYDNAMSDANKEKESIQKELQTYNEKLYQLESGKDDRLYEKPNGKKVIFKFLYRFTSKYKSKRQKLLDETKKSIDKTTKSITTLGERIDQNKSTKERIEQALQNVRSGNLENNKDFSDLQKMVRIIPIMSYELRRKYVDSKKRDFQEKVKKEIELSTDFDKLKQELDGFFNEEELKVIAKMGPILVWGPEDQLSPSGFMDKMNNSYVPENVSNIIGRMKSKAEKLKELYGDTFADAAMSGAIITTGLTPEEEMEMIKEGGRKK